MVQDKIGTRKLVKETINRIGRLSGGKDVDIDLGFSMGIKTTTGTCIQK